MHCICTQENLQGALRIVERVSGKRTALPILENILLETESGRLRVAATNLDTGIVTKIGAKVEQTGRITVPSRLFSDFIGNLPNESTVDMVSDGVTVSIKSGSFHAQIKGMDADEFPIIPQTEKNTAKVCFSADILKSALSRVMGCVASNDIRMEFTGVYGAVSKGGEVTFVATDSFRLSEVKIPSKVEGDTLFDPFILPLAVVTDIVRLIEPHTKTVSFSLDGGQGFVDIDGDIQMVSRLINAKFPDYTQIIPKTGVTEVVVNREDFLRSARLSSLFSKLQSAEVKLCVDTEKSTILLESSVSASGENTALLNAAVSGEPQEVVFNPRYLADAAILLNTSHIVLSLTNDTSPAVFRGSNEKGSAIEGFQYIVMPIRR